MLKQVLKKISLLMFFVVCLLNVGSTINASAVIECTFKAVGQLLKKTPAINITTTGFYKDFAS